MRTRRNSVGLWLSDAELTHLRQQCQITGLNTNTYLRKLIMGEHLCPRPPDAYAALLRELSAIGNNINQLAVKANALGFIDTPMLKAEALRWHKFQADIEAVFLRPGESNLKWQ